jgi:hypothetical protein
LDRSRPRAQKSAWINARGDARSPVWLPLLRLSGEGRKETEPAIKIHTAHAHAGVGEHIGAAICARVPLGTETHNREIRRAAAHVDDERDFLSPHALLIVEGGSDGLELKRHVRKADGAGDVAQRVLSLAVARRVAVDKMHGSPVHNVGERAHQPPPRPAPSQARDSRRSPP